ADGNVRKVKGTLHWVSASHAVDIEARLFDRLFNAESPDRKPKNAPEEWDFRQNLNPESLETVQAKAEPALLETEGEPAWPDAIRRFQFERHGYFCIDPDSAAGKLVGTRTGTLKDTWAQLPGQSRSMRSEVRGQRSEVRGQKSEVRSQKSEVRGQKSEGLKGRSQKSEGLKAEWQKSRIRRPKLPIPDFQFRSQISDFRFQISDFRFQIR